jgi:hypothetical protein
MTGARRRQRNQQLAVAGLVLTVFVLLCIRMTTVTLHPSLLPRRLPQHRRPVREPQAATPRPSTLEDPFFQVPMDIEEVSLDRGASGDDDSRRLVSSRDLEMEHVSSLMDAEDDSVDAIAVHELGAEDGTTPHVGDSTTPMIGKAAQCNTRVCRLCGDMQVTNMPHHAFVSNATQNYLEAHTRIAVVTGRFDDFFRMDLGLCTWMGHVPQPTLHVFTDYANTSSMRHVGLWHEARLPQQVNFSKRQMEAKGYTIDWIRAQYRFFQAFGTIGHMSVAADTSLLLHWAIVVDDDTFVNLEALRTMLTAYDMRELRLLGVIKSAFASEYNSSTASHIHELVSQYRHQFRPLYLNDNGWGGAGHFMNYAALQQFVNGSESRCVERYMIRRGYASDVTLRHCLPKLKIHTVNEKRLSHCQAAYLKRRLASPLHVTSHVKRDVVTPRFLAMWRMRLYYQVVYHRNVSGSVGHGSSAYDLLMQVGACAYGYSCKLKRCDAAHDDAATATFLAASGNNSFVPSH